MENVFVCPLCQQHFGTPNGLTMHLINQLDESHQKVSSLDGVIEMLASREGCCVVDR